MSGHKYVRMRDERAAAADEAARRAAEERERQRREALRLAAEAAARARLAAARDAVAAEETRLAALVKRARGLGLAMKPALLGESALPADAGVESCEERCARLRRTSSAVAVCVATAAELPGARERAALRDALSAATTLDDLARTATAWSGAATSDGDTVRVAMRSSETLEELERVTALGLRLTAEQQHQREALERFMAAPSVEGRDEAARALSRLDVRGLRARSKDRQAQLLRAAERLLVHRRKTLAEYDPALPSELEQLPALLSSGGWPAVAAVVAKVEAFGIERARLRVAAFIDGGAPAGIKAGPAAFDERRRAVVSSLHDARGHLADVVHPVSPWDEEDLDEFLVAGPPAFSGHDCMQAGIATAIDTLRKQGVPVDVFDANGVPLLHRSAIGVIGETPADSSTQGQRNTDPLTS